MKPKSPVSNKQAAPPSEPLWVTSGFSPRELEGKMARIEWARGDGIVDWGFYRIEVGTHGHSRRIQSIRGVLVEGLGDGMKEFDFDQADSELLHRSNENPKKYELVATLERDRPRRQNTQLAKQVRERRLRKEKDVKGADLWETFVDPVLKPVRVRDVSLPRTKDLENPGKVL